MVYPKNAGEKLGFLEIKELICCKTKLALNLLQLVKKT